MTEKQKFLSRKAFFTSQSLNETQRGVFDLHELKSQMQAFYGASLAKVKGFSQDQVILELLFYPYLESDTSQEILAPKPELFGFGFSVEEDDLVLILQTISDPLEQIEDKVDYQDRRDLSFALIVQKMKGDIKAIEGLLLEEKNSSLNLKENEAILKVEGNTITIENASIVLKSSSITLDGDTSLGGSGGTAVLTELATIVAPAGGGACSITFAGSTKTKAN